MSEYSSAGDIRAELTIADALLRERTNGQSHHSCSSATSASEETS